MIMNENKAEILFFDSESAEKFFSHYNRLGFEIIKRALSYENKMILFAFVCLINNNFIQFFNFKKSTLKIVY